MTKENQEELEYKIDSLLKKLSEELLKACKKFKPMNSPHEGWAVIKEEVDELWEHVRANTGDSDDAMKEALQIAAMGLRYIIDLENKE